MKLPKMPKITVAEWRHIAACVTYGILGCVLLWLMLRSFLVGEL